MENTRSIYLDYNSTSMIRPQVIKVLIEAHKNFNASSVHQFGVEAFGSEHPEIDSEVIALAMAVFNGNNTI